MGPEAKILAATIGLGLVHIVAAAHGASRQRGYRWSASARDAPVAPLVGLAGRLRRAARNFAETFPFFAAAILLAEQLGISNTLTVASAYTYLAARVLYLILYASGIFLWRSIVWNIATISILTLLWGVFVP